MLRMALEELERLGFRQYTASPNEYLLRWDSEDGSRFALVGDWHGERIPTTPTEGLAAVLYRGGGEIEDLDHVEAKEPPYEPLLRRVRSWMF